MAEKQLAREKSLEQERMKLLWRRLRVAAIAIGRLQTLRKQLVTYGVPEPFYTLKHSLKQFHTHVEPHPRCLLLPHSKVKQVSNLVMAFLLLWSSTITPYQVSFTSDHNDVWWEMIEAVITSLFACDIVITFLSAYYDEDNRLVVSRKTIAWRYLRSWFCVDLLSWYNLFSFPTQLFDLEEEDSVQYRSFGRMMRLPRLYRLLRILRLFKTFQVASRSSLTAWLLRFTKIDPDMMKALRFLVSFVLLSHVLACLWYFTAKLTDFEEDSWVTRCELIDKPIASQYVASVYFVLTTLATVGYGDITPYTKLERAFAICLMTVGVGFYSYSIGNFASILSTTDSKNKHLAHQLATLSALAKIIKLNPSVEKRVERFLRRNSHNGIFIRFDQEAVLAELPGFLRTEICLYMFDRFVQRIFFFQDKDPTFIAAIVPNLKNVMLRKGDVIYRTHDFPEEIYFVLIGRVDFEAVNGRTFKTFVQGSYFGEIEILAGRLRMSTARVATDTADLLVLPKDKFISMMEKFPKVASEVKDTALLRNEDQQARTLGALNRQKELHYSRQLTNVHVAQGSEYKVIPAIQSRLWRYAKEVIKKPTFRAMWKNMSSRRQPLRSRFMARKSILSAPLPTVHEGVEGLGFHSRFPEARANSRKTSLVSNASNCSEDSQRSDSVVIRRSSQMSKVIDLDSSDELLNGEESPEILVTPRMIQESALTLALKSHIAKLDTLINSTAERLSRLEHRKAEVYAASAQVFVK